MPSSRGFPFPGSTLANSCVQDSFTTSIATVVQTEAVSLPFYFTDNLTTDSLTMDVGAQFGNPKQTKNALSEWKLSEGYTSAKNSSNMIQLPALDTNYQALHGFQILVVDDEEDSLELLKIILETEGAIVTTVTSADAALQSLACHKPNVLISDIGMPKTDGYMLIRQLRLQEGQDAPLPAIALTAYAGQEEQSKAVAAGFQVYLAKPISPDDLIEAIMRLIH